MNYNELEAAIRKVVSFFEVNKYHYALVGGLAVSFRTIERTTKDVDLALSVADDKEAELIIRSLQNLGFQPVTLLENKKHRKISTVRLLSDTYQGIFIDLLFCTSGIEKEVVETAEKIEILKDLYVNVASTSSLIAMKTLSSTHKQRRQDLLDLDNLIREANDEELKEAKKLILLIQTREFNDGKNLSEHFSLLLKDNDRKEVI